ncbi:hypothetical protein N1851_013354 [Merluccius polli]|uniref:Uncharacterized protein n=1 Tax=Merluccius polli TaxID=89951 RepID=A0AA47MVE0_MERPO|nr:hypothetical protein N1851_013354 [Merluccius polli]
MEVFTLQDQVAAVVVVGKVSQGCFLLLEPQGGGLTLGMDVALITPPPYRTTTLSPYKHENKHASYWPRPRPGGVRLAIQYMAVAMAMAFIVTICDIGVNTRRYRRGKQGSCPWARAPPMCLEGPSPLVAVTTRGWGSKPGSIKDPVPLIMTVLDRPKNVHRLTRPETEDFSNRTIAEPQAATEQLQVIDREQVEEEEVEDWDDLDQAWGICSTKGRLETKTMALFQKFGHLQSPEVEELRQAFQRSGQPFRGLETEFKQRKYF